MAAKTSRRARSGEASETRTARNAITSAPIIQKAPDCDRLNCQPGFDDLPPAIDRRLGVRFGRGGGFKSSAWARFRISSSSCSSRDVLPRLGSSGGAVVTGIYSTCVAASSASEDFGLRDDMVQYEALVPRIVYSPESIADECCGIVYAQRCFSPECD